jgi:ribose transport system ATP-binding protein
MASSPSLHGVTAIRDDGQGAVRIRGLSKSFGATAALDNVDFDLDFGEIHALVGENGAGKSTLIRILGGVHSADRGQIEVGGVPRKFANPRDAIVAGIVTIPQELRLVAALSIAENIALGQLPLRRYLGFIPSIDRARMRDEARQYLEQLNFKPDLDRPVLSLSFAERQLLVIARALRLQCRIFILDEPTAALEDREVARLFEVLDRLKKSGTAIIYISHRLDEIVQLSDRATILRDGKTVAVRTGGGFTVSDLIADMTGRAIGDVAAVSVTPGRTLLEEVDDRSGHLSVRVGETVGLAGLLGSGSDRMLRRLFGIGKDAAQVRVGGGAMRSFASPAEAITFNIGFVPGERGLGLVMNQSIRDNILLPSLHLMNRAFWIDRAKGDAVVRELMEMLDIRPRRPELPAAALSGGNQQKVILAKWLARRVSVLLLDEPTHGIDMAARMQIHAMVRKFTKDGGGVIVNSSDLAELAQLCETVLAIRDDRVVRCIDRQGGMNESHLRAALAGVEP